MRCRPPRQRVLIADNHTAVAVTAADAGDAVSLPSITTDIDLSDHPLGSNAD